MATTPPPKPTTGSGFKLSIRPFGSDASAAYTAATWLTALTQPKINVDGADTTLLSGLQMTDTPTLPKYEASGTMQLVEGDATYETMLASCKQFPVQFLSFLVTGPNGATKSFDGWLSAFEPSQLTVKDVRTIDFTISITSTPVFTPAPPTT